MVNAAMIVVGLLLGAYVLVADVGLRLAFENDNGDLAATVSAMYLSDPVVDDIVAQTYLFQADDGGTGFPESISWRRRAVVAEPDRPYWWASLGYAQIADGDLDAAQASFESALRMQSNSLRSLRGLGAVAIELEDQQPLQSVIDRMCDLGQPECGADAEAVSTSWTEVRPYHARSPSPAHSMCEAPICRTMQGWVHSAGRHPCFALTEGAGERVRE